MWYEFFVVGGIAFWLLTLVVFGVIIAALENDSGWFATMAVGGYLVAIWLLGDAHPLTYLADNIRSIMVYALFYLLIGVGWAYARWNIFTAYSGMVARHAETEFKATEWSEERKAVFCHSRRIEPGSMSDEEIYRGAWLYYVSDHGIQVNTPQIRNYKSRFTAWMTYWPASMFWTACHDLVIKGYNWIYIRMSGHLQRIADKNFEGVTQ
jgi:hypothetical protein